MTRERLLGLIRAYYCIDVPISVCNTLTCAECAEKVLTEYERKLHNKAIEDCIKSMREETCEWEYAIAFIESCKLE